MDPVTPSQWLLPRDLTLRDKAGLDWDPCPPLHNRYYTALTFAVYKYFFFPGPGIQHKEISSKELSSTWSRMQEKKKKWNTATRDEGQKDSWGGRESEGSSSRDDRGSRERREKEGEIVKRDIDDPLLALKPCCPCHRITQRQEHLLYPTAAA